MYQSSMPPQVLPLNVTHSEYFMSAKMHLTRWYSDINVKGRLKMSAADYLKSSISLKVMLNSSCAFIAFVLFYCFSPTAEIKKDGYMRSTPASLHPDCLKMKGTISLGANKAYIKTKKWLGALAETYDSRYCR